MVWLVRIPFPRYSARMRFVLGGLVLGAATAIYGSSLDDAAERTRSAVGKFMAESNAPAVSVAVAMDGKVVFAEAWGSADLESETPATVESRFPLGSLTKPFTAALIAKLAEQNALDWEAPVERYLTAFPYYGKGVTLRLIAAHLSGIGDAFNARNSGTLQHFDAAKDVLPYVCASPLLSPPGEATHYSTDAYTVLGAVVEKTTAGTFMDALSEHVLDPLTLTTVAALDPREEQAELVASYTKRNEEVQPAPPHDPSYKLAGAGLIGTASDVARFASSLQRGGFLRETTIRKMFTAQPDKKGKRTAFGLGWAVGAKAAFEVNWTIGPDNGTREIVHHPGVGMGISHWMVLDRRTGIAVVVMTNLREAPVGGPFFDAILESYLGAAAEIRNASR